MEKQYPKALLASYATFKELYKSEKYISPYQILAEFIRYVIREKALYNFTAPDIQIELECGFGFNLPVAVIRTTIKQMPEIIKNNGCYSVNIEKLKENNEFQEYKVAAEIESDRLIDELCDFVEKREGFSVNRDNLYQEFIAFLLDDYEGGQNYRTIISTFVFENESKTAIKKKMSEIREGSILYSGLSYNISEYGSIKEPLTLFLDTEILFDIVGFNGELYKTLASDFLQLVEIANKHKRMITLKFFSEVKQDVDNFFSKAEDVVKGRGESMNVAMQNIVTGCKDVSDIKVRQTDFYLNLRNKYGIIQDEKDNYYTDSDIPFNIEAEEFDGLTLENPFDFEAIRFCSHINKLRKAVNDKDYFSCKYLFVSNTKRVLEASAVFSEKLKKISADNSFCDFAVNLSKITNLLWFKLNRGFGGQEFPKNLDVVVKARTILSGYITQEIYATYQDIKAKYRSGELSEEIAAAHILALREKATMPEQLTLENLDENLAFNNDYFNKYAESMANDKRLMHEKDETINRLNESNMDLQLKLEEQNVNRMKDHKKINELTETIRVFQEKEFKKKQIVNKLKNIALFVWAVFWKLLLLGSLIAVIYIICCCCGITEVGEILSIIFGVLGAIPVVISIVKKDIKKYIFVDDSASSSIKTDMPSEKAGKN